MLQGTNDTRYAFVTGLIRAREARLLKKSHFDRLIEAEIGNFKAILSDTPYAAGEEFLETLSTAEKLERFFFEKYCLHEEIKEIILLPHAIHNLKVRLKKRPERLLSPVNLFWLESSEEILAIINDYLTHKNSFLLSAKLDRFYCERIWKSACISEFFTEYFKLFFDLENIRSFFRARQFENPLELFKEVYIPYGTIPERVFVEHLSKDFTVVVRAFRNTPYDRIIEQGGGYLETDGSFLRLERLIDEMRLQFLKTARYYTFGIEPLFGYYNFKLNEIRLLRQVYMGKLYNIPTAQLRESLPDVW